MNLLADENVHGAIVEWLRSTGHDVLWAAESLQAESDTELLALARDENRVLLTADMDFGEMIYRLQLASTGIILLRLESLSAANRVKRIAAQWSFIQAQADGHFIVVGKGKTRVRPLTANGA